jgi:hypothetical protein
MHPPTSARQKYRDIAKMRSEVNALKSLFRIVTMALLVSVMLTAGNSLLTAPAHATCGIPFTSCDNDWCLVIVLFNPCSLNTTGTGEDPPADAPPASKCGVDGLDVQYTESVGHKTFQYNYDFHCGTGDEAPGPLPIGNFHVAGNYDTVTGQTNEVVISLGASFVAPDGSTSSQKQIASEWICPQDVWAGGGGCTTLQGTHPGDLTVDPLFHDVFSQLGGPVSAQALTNAQHVKISAAAFQARVAWRQQNPGLYPYWNWSQHCNMTNVKVVKLTDSKSEYDYALSCTGPTPSLSVAVSQSGTYDYTTHMASENLNASSATFSSQWTCPRDPWSYTGACDTQLQPVLDPGTQDSVDDPFFGLNVAHTAEPVGAAVLTDAQHQQLLSANLQANTFTFTDGGSFPSAAPSNSGSPPSGNGGQPSPSGSSSAPSGSGSPPSGGAQPGPSGGSSSPPSSNGGHAASIPPGTAGKLSDGWQLTVNSVQRNATAAVLAYNSTNKPPPAGQQFVLISLTVTHTGPGSDNFDDSARLRVVSAAGKTYDSSCPPFPKEVPGTNVPSGTTESGNSCFTVPTSEVNSLTLLDAPSADTSAWTAFQLPPG